MHLYFVQIGIFLRDLKCNYSSMPRVITGAKLFLLFLVLYWLQSQPAAKYALAGTSFANLLSGAGLGHLGERVDCLLSGGGLGHLGKGWIVCGTTTRRLPYWANELP